ncbi:MAG: hypothetical protein ACRCTJ_06900 [Brevinema sp.]
MRRLFAMSFFLLFTSCEIEKIEGIPSLNPPLGLVVQQVGADRIGVYFSAYNKETYFYGYNIFISTQLADLTKRTNTVFGVDPRSITGSVARLLTNSNPVETATSLKEFIMSTVPELPFVYPKDSLTSLGSVSVTNPTITNFLTSSLNKMPPNSDGTLANEPFVSGTTYYFVVYAYSAINNESQRLSLPSEIVHLEFR